MKYLITTLQGHEDEDWSDAATGVYIVEADNQEEAEEKVKQREVQLELEMLDLEEEGELEIFERISKYGWEAVEYNNDNTSGVVISTVTLLDEVEIL
jgi:hypothetical protein